MPSLDNVNNDKSFILLVYREEVTDKLVGQEGSFLLKIDSKRFNSCHNRERLIANSGKVITLDNIHKTLAKAAEKALCFITHVLDGYNRRLQVTTDTNIMHMSVERNYASKNCVYQGGNRFNNNASKGIRYCEADLTVVVGKEAKCFGKTGAF
jgi:hypothetical protein